MNCVSVWCRCVICFFRIVNCVFDSLVFVLKFSFNVVFRFMWFFIGKLNVCGVFLWCILMFCVLLWLVGMFLCGRFGIDSIRFCILVCIMLSCVVDVFSLLLMFDILVIMLDVFLFLFLSMLICLDRLLWWVCSFLVWVWMVLCFVLSVVKLVMLSM